MTLVITELSDLGIAMAADSAVTFGSGRVLVGAQKLQPVRQLNAGVSIWGYACVQDKIADEWVYEFIRNYTPDNPGIWSFAEALADGLQSELGVIDSYMGIHVAGYENTQEGRLPAFYHVHNGHHGYRVVNGQLCLQGEPPREFRAHRDVPPRHFSPGQIHQTRNGDFFIHVALFDRLNELMKELQRLTGLEFPYPRTLATRGEYLRFWVSLAGEIYRLSNRRMRVLPQPETAGDASIGGPVTVLTISERGIESFYTK